MKLQNLSVVFVIIALPIILVTSYYISLQIDTINMQTAYNQKLTEATKDAIQAFETNTVEWNEEYSSTGDSKRRDVMAAMNTFVNSFANNLGMAGASKEELLSYIPAVAYIGYDGYYIYAPSEVPITVLNENEVTVLLNEKLVMVGGTPRDAKPIAIETIPSTNKAKDYKDGIINSNADEIEKYEGSILYEWEDDGTKNPGLDGRDGTYYAGVDSAGNKVYKYFTLEQEYAKKEYKHILKQYMPYSARYDNGKTGTQKIDITVNYTLDNYVTISGIVNGEYVKKSGYFQFYFMSYDFPAAHRMGSGEWVTASFTGMHSWGKEYPYEWPNALWYTYEELSEYVWYNGLSNPEKFTYVYESENNTKVYIDNLGGDWQAFQITSKGERVNLDSLSEIKYKKIYTSNRMRETQKMYLMALNGPNKGKHYNNSGHLVTCTVPYTYESSANNYFVETFKFSEWLNENLNSIKPKDCTNFTLNEDYEIFLDMDPEDEESDFFNHKSEIIKQCIISGLNQAITSYSRNNDDGLEYKLPILTETEWEQALSNVSIITFAQQIPIGMKYFNSYAIATSTVNKEYVSTDGFYMYHKNHEEYHLPNCQFLKDEWVADSTLVNMGGCLVYKNTDFVAKSYESKDPTTGEIKKHYYYLHSDDIEATQACYNCVVQRSLYEKPGSLTFSQERNQGSAYYNALARERYVSHEFLNYEWDPTTW